MTTEILLARQPILDADQQIVAYELLFRDAEWAPELRPVGVAGDVATSRVLLNAFEELDITAVVGRHQAYVNFTRQLILDPPPFDHRRITIEVLEDIEVDALLVERLKALRETGFAIALDDFVYGPEYEPLLELASVVKLDIRAHDEAGLAAQVELVRRPGITLLAEKVETQAEFARCRALGFELFQGYFFALPERISGHRAPALRHSVLQLVAALQDPEADFERIRDIIITDPIMTFKLIKLVNSAAMNRGSNVTSLQSALGLLGLARVRSWASLLALSRLTDKSTALAVSTLTRAHLCAALGCIATRREAADDYFTAGLLSTMAAYFDRNLSELLQELPISAPIQRALLRHHGHMGTVLKACEQYDLGAYEQIQWWDLEGLGITAGKFETAYREALTWANLGEELLLNAA